ncbi:hypothetical protein G7B40_039965 [Aetokthonos hydrillicola Thurmond2011]|jgi:hypothetical protein|uniref:Uncharacterized protein n=1 Tax=Aetokthonos hydrillicola Thurmond2011 TaxID=2712845 RepID=A0AAP5IFB4_9CYAN|nr:hypothetical protein [Aetokthonos hydrillicola]MBW4590101.1 hypothetical protein [Aetokthonos hydrillicola CCALA 1050]MDR9900668.1 hypothetical protein [Aetokthonos hydrillicola Thurmond2011]
MLSVFLFLVIFISMCLFLYQEDDLPLQFIGATDTTAFRQYEFVGVFDPLDSVGIDFFTSIDSPVQDVNAQEGKTIVSAETPIPELSSTIINVNEAIPTTELPDAITLPCSEELAAVEKTVPKTRKKRTTKDNNTPKMKTTRKSKAKKEVEDQNQPAA